MLKGNLSTRPFYNDRLVTGTIVVVAVAALALTAFNAMELVPAPEGVSLPFSLSKQRAELSTRINADLEAARLIELNTAELKSAIDVSGMKLLTNSAHEANDLIDGRTFSWTAFLGVIEKTLPYDARLVEVAPKPEKGVMHVGITVVCKTPDDLFTFVEALEKAGVFHEVVPAERSANEDGTETALVQAVYQPSPEAPPAPATKKAGKGRP